MRHILVALLFAGTLAAQTPRPGGLTAADIERLEAQTDDWQAHSRLLLHYTALTADSPERLRPLRRKHILWLIEHRPDEYALRSPVPYLLATGDPLADPEGHTLAAEAWRKHFGGDPPAAIVYANAIDFLATADWRYATKLAGDALARYPKSPEVSKAVGRLKALTILGVRGLDRFGHGAAFDDEAAKSEAAQEARRELGTAANVDLLTGAGNAFNTQSAALSMRGRDRQGVEALVLAQQCVDRAVELEPSNRRAADAARGVYQIMASRERDPARKLQLLEKAAAFRGDERFAAYVLADLARAQFDAGAMEKAAATAAALLESAAKYAEPGNSTGAIHWGNIVLGRIAMKEGKVEEAAKRLIAAGKTEKTPVLSSFGPDWQLAKELANSGESGVVLEYIELCRKFWEMGGRALDFWAGAIRAGGVPTFSRIEQMSGGRRSDAALMELAGKPAPELTLKDIAGKRVSLSDYRGKPVLVDFWATWCAPCRKEMPLFEKLHREGVVVLTVDADEPEATVSEYMKAEGFTFPVLLANGTDTVKRWGVVAFPTTVMVDAEGRVAAVEVGERGERWLREMVGKAK